MASLSGIYKHDVYALGNDYYVASPNDIFNDEQHGEKGIENASVYNSSSSSSGYRQVKALFHNHPTILRVSEKINTMSNSDLGFWIQKVQVCISRLNFIK